MAAPGPAWREPTPSQTQVTYPYIHRISTYPLDIHISIYPYIHGTYSRLGESRINTMDLPWNSMDFAFSGKSSPHVFPMDIKINR